MKSYKHVGSLGALLVLTLGACEVLIMISPFAGFFYATVRFEPFLGFLSESPLTAWLDGFFLNHSVVTTSMILEWQREIGELVFSLGIWGFLISAFQVYWNKITGRGVATGLLYRVCRHPQYLCLGIAGWGLLTVWPRFLLLGLWITMLFLYAALARFEEWRMNERFGESYRNYAQGQAAFFPGSPFHRLFEVSFARIRPAALGWISAYVFCLILLYSLGFGMRAYTQSHTVILLDPERRMAVISAWPQSGQWVKQVFDTALASEEVKQQLEVPGEHPVLATILPAGYVMKGMYYKLPPPAQSSDQGRSSLVQIARIAAFMLVPFLERENFMGIDPDETDLPVQVVLSRAEKPFQQGLSMAEVFDASVRLTPLLVVDVEPPPGQVASVQVPLPQNRWGSRVVMPLF